MRALIVVLALVALVSCGKKKAPKENTQDACFDKVDNDSDG